MAFKNLLLLSRGPCLRFFSPSVVSPQTVAIRVMALIALLVVVRLVHLAGRIVDPVSAIEKSLWSFTAVDVAQVNVGAQSPRRDREFGMVVVHCKESNMTFLDQVPRDWLLNVYENCGQNVSQYSVPFVNKGPEECTAYLDFIIRHYNHLPQVLIFMQADGLRGYGKSYRQLLGHTPFNSIEQLENVTRDIILIQRKTQFLHYGPNQGRWGQRILLPEPTVAKDITRMFAAMGFNATNSTRTISRPMASFAVHRDRVTARPLSEYVRFRDWIPGKATRKEALSYCWSLENLWHVMFGEPPILPISSSVDHIPRDRW